MGITIDGWLDWAIRLPGTPSHTNNGTSSARGIFLHSAEGYESVLLNPNSQWGYNGSHSWHLTNLFDGRVYQHYPFHARCWHATAANNEYIGVENEGMVPRELTLTDQQIASAQRFIADISAWKGWTPTRTGNTAQTLWEHREVVWLGGSSSTCPNGRIPWDRILVAPAPPAEEEIMNPVWAEWADRPANIPYRSYQLFSTTTGMKKRLVANTEEHNALLGIGEVPMPASLETLKAYAGTPEPDAP